MQIVGIRFGRPWKIWPVSGEKSTILTSLALMKNADYLFLIDAAVPSNRQSVFFPSKLAEYLGSGKPIVGLTPKQGATARILRELGHHAVDLGGSAGNQGYAGNAHAETTSIGKQRSKRGKV